MTAQKSAFRLQLSAVSIIAISFILLTLFVLPNVAHAQVGGTGAEVIRPVEKLWQVSRNISYLVLTIVLMVIGLMVMLRARINPQTVIGLQQALPGVVIALVGITFSYFIASLIIDMAFLLAQALGIVVLVGVASPTPSVADAQLIITGILNTRNLLTFFGEFVVRPELAVAADTIGRAVIEPLVRTVPVIGNTLGSIPFIGSIIGAPLAAVILFITLVNAFFNLFFGLVTAYVNIIVSVILGPFLIMASAIPGRGGNLMNWMRGLLGNVLIFPAVFGAFVLVAALLGYEQPWRFGAGGVPTAIGPFNQPLPLFSNLDTNFVRYILAYGIILASPGIPDLVRNLVGGAAVPQQLGQAVGAAQKTGQGIATGAFKTIGKVVGI